MVDPSYSPTHLQGRKANQEDIPDVPVKPAKAAPKAAAKGKTTKARAAPVAAAVEEAPIAVEEVEVERPAKPESAAGKGAMSQKKVDQVSLPSMSVATSYTEI
jgi:hypothetical protein